MRTYKNQSPNYLRIGFRHDSERQNYLFLESGPKYPNQSSNLKFALVGQAPSCAFRSVAGFNFTVALLRYLVTSHSALYCSAAMYSKPVLELLLALLPDFLCSSEVLDHDNKWLWWRHFSHKVIDNMIHNSTAMIRCFGYIVTIYIVIFSKKLGSKYLQCGLWVKPSGQTKNGNPWSMKKITHDGISFYCGLTWLWLFQNILGHQF